MEHNESAVYAASENLQALEHLAQSLESKHTPDLNFALESEVLMGNNTILSNHFSNKSAAMRATIAQESIGAAIGEAFKTFIRKLIEALKSMVAWLTDKALSGKNALKEAVIKGYNNLPPLNYRLSWRVTLNPATSPEMKKFDESWKDRLDPWKLDMVNGGPCLKVLENAVNRFRRENIVSQFKKNFIDVQKWEEKAFHEAVDLDIALIRKPREEAQAAREEYKQKLADQLDGDSEDIEGFANYIMEYPKDVKECWDGSRTQANTSLTALNFTETSVITVMRAVSVEEFSHMRKEHAANLNGVISTLDRVNTETAQGENILQQCVQAMRLAYTKRLSWLLRASTSIQETFSIIATAFRGMLEVEATYLRFCMERIKIEMNTGEYDDWKEDFDAFNKRSEALNKVMKMI